MLKNRKGGFRLLLIVILSAVFVGCVTTIGGRALIHTDPVSDSDIQVDIYRPDKAWQGTTLLADNHKKRSSRIIEVNMQGQVIWEYELPGHLKKYTNPGFDVEWLPNNHILFVLPQRGVYEINRAGEVVWSYVDSKVSHDADRLPNGNTLITGSTKIVEVTPEGEIAWQLSLRGVDFVDHRDRQSLGFYKAERLSPR